MLSLMLKMCLAGQPCKEVRVADFFTAQAGFMCEYNREGMQESATREKRPGTFSCKAGLAEEKLTPLATLNFKVCVASGTPGEQCDGFALAQFYGAEYAEPACAKNADHLRPALEKAAGGTHARVKLDCFSN
uniref:Uncharacterized protein n=1 Tax=Pseudomonas phage HRDY3 TaxID=3236930 RepID=A0AB39CEU3_9VIRU